MGFGRVGVSKSPQKNGKITSSPHSTTVSYTHFSMRLLSWANQNFQFLSSNPVFARRILLVEKGESVSFHAIWSIIIQAHGSETAWIKLMLDLLYDLLVLTSDPPLFSCLESSTREDFSRRDLNSRRISPIIPPP